MQPRWHLPEGGEGALPTATNPLDVETRRVSKTAALIASAVSMRGRSNWIPCPLADAR